MSNLSRLILFIIAVVTAISIITWQATGGDWYTKYKVIEQVESTPDPNDPLAAAGFYDGDMTTNTIIRDEFHFGLLPTPANLIDKHAISVTSIIIPLWVFGLTFAWFQKRRTKRHESTS